MRPRLPLLLVLLTASISCAGEGRHAGDAAASSEASTAAPSDAQSDGGAAPKPDPLAREGIAEGPALADTASGAPPAAAPQAASAMLIRTGTAQVEVDSLDRAVAQVRAVAARLGGYVATSTVQGGRERAREAELEVKIPSARWDQALAALQPIGRVESVTVKSEDVGEEFVDVQARVANARRLEERLIGLLSARTGKLEEVLQVERELARVREEIERYEGRLRYLSTRIATSTLTVQLHEPRPVVGEYPGASVLGDSVRSAWRNFVGFVAGFISSLGILVPLGLLLAAAWWVFRRLRGPRTPRPAPEKPRVEE